MKLRKATKLLLVPALGLSLTGCDQKRIEIAQPPAERLTCAAEPTVPDEPVTDAKVATYVVDMRGAWGDCSNAVKWLSDWFAALPE